MPLNEEIKPSHLAMTVYLLNTRNYLQLFKKGEHFFIGEQADFRHLITKDIIYFAHFCWLN